MFEVRNQADFRASLFLARYGGELYERSVCPMAASWPPCRLFVRDAPRFNRDMLKNKAVFFRSLAPLYVVGLGAQDITYSIANYILETEGKSNMNANIIRTFVDTYFNDAVMNKQKVESKKPKYELPVLIEPLDIALVEDPIGHSLGKVIPHVQTWSMRQRVMWYVRWLLSGRYSSRMDDIYDDALLHYRDIATRVSVVISILRDLPKQSVISVPGDGIGVAALACFYLGLQCISTDPGGLCDVAIKLGIMHAKVDIAKHFEIYKPDRFTIRFFSNLSRFVDITNYVSSGNVIVYDSEMIVYRNLFPVMGSYQLQVSKAVLPYIKNPIIEYSRFRSFDLMKSRSMSTYDDPVVERILRVNKKYDSTSPIKAVLNIRHVRTPNDFLLTTRRIANLRGRRDGDTQFVSGYINIFSSNGGVYRTANGFMREKTLIENKKMYELSREYDIPDSEYFCVSLRIMPIYVKYAYRFNQRIPIQLLQVCYNEDTGYYDSLFYAVNFYAADKILKETTQSSDVVSPASFIVLKKRVGQKRKCRPRLIIFKRDEPIVSHEYRGVKMKS